MDDASLGICNKADIEFCLSEPIRPDSFKTQAGA